MPAYNAAGTIREAIDSALAQTLSDLEVLVVDDGSTDETAEIVETHADPRVRLLRNPRNLGIPATRQRGAEEARGEYLAILDSDDIAHPRRFERQVAYLDAHPDCALVGTWARIVSADGRFRKVRRKPARSEALRARMLFTNLVKDATAMTRTALVREYRFREDYPVCELTELWQRMSARYEVANIPEVLTSHREHEGSITERNPTLMRQMKIRLAGNQLRALGLGFSEDNLSRNFELSRPRLISPDRAFLDWAESWFVRLRAANRSSHLYPESAFQQALGEYWWKLCREAGGLGRARWWIFWTSPLALPALRYRAGWWAYRLWNACICGREATPTELVADLYR